MSMDTKLSSEIIQYSEWLKQQSSERNDRLDGMVKMFNLEWDEEAKAKNIRKENKVTLSPDPRNSTLGGVRLLAATEPTVNIPREGNDEIDNDLLDDLEKFDLALITNSGRIQGNPIQYDGALSGLLFGMIHIGITKTSDLVEHAKGASKAAIARAERVAETTPFLFQVFDPRKGYPEFDSLGMRAYVTESEMTNQAILDQFGKAAQDALGKSDSNYNPYDTSTVWSFYDTEMRQVWLEGSNVPLLQDKHGLPFIPVAAHISEGSRLFEDPEDQIQPFLYTMWKSGLWERQNLSYTALYNLIYALAFGPVWKHEADPNTVDAKVKMDFRGPLRVVEVPAGHKFDSITQRIVDESVYKAIEIADNKGTESMIYKQALGEALGSGTPFSTVALLAQAGRLPLIMTQKKLGWALGDALRICHAWMREEPDTYQAYRAGSVYNVDASGLPANLEVEVVIDISLPQDQLQNINMLNQLEGKLPKRWGAENILKIGNYDELHKEMMQEQATEGMFRMLIEQKINEIAQAKQMQMQQAMQEQMQQQPVDEGMPMGAGMEGQAGMPMPGEMGEMPPTMQGGLPPEMIAGGMQGPEEVI